MTLPQTFVDSLKKRRLADCWRPKEGQAFFAYQRTRSGRCLYHRFGPMICRKVHKTGKTVIDASFRDVELEFTRDWYFTESKPGNE
jgi:hypothetical protein